MEHFAFTGKECQTQGMKSLSDRASPSQCVKQALSGLPSDACQHAMRGATKE
jgi:hypothetical protein